MSERAPFHLGSVSGNNWPAAAHSAGRAERQALRWGGAALDEDKPVSDALFRSYSGLLTNVRHAQSAKDGIRDGVEQYITCR